MEPQNPHASCKPSVGQAPTELPWVMGVKGGGVPTHPWVLGVEGGTPTPPRGAGQRGVTEPYLHLCRAKPGH